MRSLFLAICLFLGFKAEAQILKTNIVEHFTNSNCGICASKNPGIFSDLNMHPNTLHIAFHPSSPYASCFFSMQNPVENDARTNYYGIFGGTPKLIVNGALVTVPNLAASLIDVDDDSSNFSVRTTQEFILIDSVLVKVFIKKVGLDTTHHASLFVGATEDTVFQVTGNNESQHHDVFRKSLSAISGDLVTMPQILGDSITLSFAYKIPSNWNTQRLKSLAILQNTTSKMVINSSQSINIASMPNSIDDLQSEAIIFYPNPIQQIIYFDPSLHIDEIEFMSLDGKIILNHKSPLSSIQLPNLADGIYFMRIKRGNDVKVTKVRIQK